MEHFSYKDGVVYMGVVHGCCTCIKVLKRRAGLGYRWTVFDYINSVMLFKNINTTKELKNKAVLS